MIIYYPNKTPKDFFCHIRYEVWELAAVKRGIRMLALKLYVGQFIKMRIGVSAFVFLTSRHIKQGYL
jgi:hypothetical protein